MAFLDKKGSAAWIKASMPAAAVTCGGQLTVNIGSTMATLGKRAEEATAFFTFTLRSRKMACLVTSAPVPEVVGMMIVGLPR